MRIKLPILLLLISHLSFGQSDFEQTVEKYKKDLKEKGTHPIEMEFGIDTFTIEKNVVIALGKDNSDLGMTRVCYDAAKQYDLLLNKYYRKLLAVLKGEDKKLLISAQKSWLAFRDSEISLVEVISKEEYSGGGTAQNLTEGSYYLELIKSRTVALFDHYVRATQSY
ncbi:MAG: DUF1311 domain-containing protein [Sphingobacteriales bacterium]|nr:MAG: DUF1311 domain-containing protein [Sphingobacteriales bacterium]